MTHQTRTTALKWASAAVIGFGLSLTLSLFTPLAQALDLFVRLATLSTQEGVLLTAVDGRLFVAISGGILAGWGMMIWLITTRIYAHDPALGGPLIVIPTCVWFVVDSTGSVIAGAPFNAVLNLSFLAILVLPVIWRGAPSAVVE